MSARLADRRHRDGVEAEAAKRGGVIPAERIGELCLERLAAIDRGAYFQFAGTLPEITPEIGVFPAAGFRPDR